MEIAPSVCPTSYFPSEESPNKVFKGMEEVPIVETLEDLIAELRRVFQSDSVNVEYVHALMTSYKSKPSEWKKYAKFDRYR